MKPRPRPCSSHSLLVHSKSSNPLSNYGPMKAMRNFSEIDIVPIDDKLPFLRAQNSYCVGSIQRHAVRVVRDGAISVHALPETQQSLLYDNGLIHRHQIFDVNESIFAAVQLKGLKCLHDQVAKIFTVLLTIVDAVSQIVI